MQGWGGWNDDNTETARRLYFVEGCQAEFVARQIGAPSYSAVLSRLSRMFGRRKAGFVPPPLPPQKKKNPPPRPPRFGRRAIAVGDRQPGDEKPDGTCPRFAHHDRHVDAVMAAGGFLHFGVGPDGRMRWPLLDARGVPVDQFGNPLPKRRVGR